MTLHSHVLCKEIKPARAELFRQRKAGGVPWREFIDYKTSMITAEDPMWGFLFY